MSSNSDRPPTEDLSENITGSTHKRPRDPRPCGYCWDHHCDLDGMECAEKHWPEGGFAETHPECWRMVERYMEAVYEDRKHGVRSPLVVELGGGDAR